MSQNSSSPLVVGTGLICLDAIEIENSSHYKLLTGGTCINVLTILKSFGWNAIPIGRIGNDAAGNFVFRDLHCCDIDTIYISRRDEDSTPIYIQRNTQDGHQFIHRCPYCANRFADFTPVDPDSLSIIFQEIPKNIEVCYIDRVSLASVSLARECKSRGAMVYFEPNRMDDTAIFQKCLELADIVKYSSEKMSHAKEITDTISLPLEIETFGKEGLHYRINHENIENSWNHVPAVQCHEFVDAAGSGDWFSAELIHQIHFHPTSSQFRTDRDTIRSLIQKAQQKASINCRYEGARGAMYRQGTVQISSGFCPYCGQ